jgi:site-specific DNA-methyltransferase (adenine-specific)
VFSKGTYGREKSDGNENTITKQEFMEWTKSIWTMKAESAKKIGHPAPFPEELPRRLINLFSFSNDIILDPFMGSGTTAIVAIREKRNFVGYEINKKYKTLSNNRIKIEQQKLLTLF